MNLRGKAWDLIKWRVMKYRLAYTDEEMKVFQEELFFRSSGYVVRAPVKAGDTIKAGDILADQQVDDLLNQLEQARIDLNVAQANLAKAEAQQEFDTAKAQIEVNIWENYVEMARLELENAVGIQGRERAQINLDNAEQNMALARLNLEFASEYVDPYQKQAVERNQTGSGTA